MKTEWCVSTSYRASTPHRNVTVEDEYRHERHSPAAPAAPPSAAPAAALAAALAAAVLPAAPPLAWLPSAGAACAATLPPPSERPSERSAYELRRADAGSSATSAEARSASHTTHGASSHSRASP
eukprot:4070038-Prymnesium_polylepis.1